MSKKRKVNEEVLRLIFTLLQCIPEEENKEDEAITKSLIISFTSSNVLNVSMLGRGTRTKNRCSNAYYFTANGTLAESNTTQ